MWYCLFRRLGGFVSINLWNADKSGTKQYRRDTALRQRYQRPARLCKRDRDNTRDITKSPQDRKDAINRYESRGKPHLHRLFMISTRKQSPHLEDNLIILIACLRTKTTNALRSQFFLRHDKPDDADSIQFSFHY